MKGKAHSDTEWAKIKNMGELSTVDGALGGAHNL
jgi:hypothetical protein